MATGDNVNTLALLFLALMSLVLLGASRQKAVGAVLITAAFIPLGQRVIVGGLNFYFLRILLLVGIGRLLLRGETTGFRFDRIDKVFIAWVLTGMVCGILRGPRAETFGAVYDSIGIYFLFRILVQDS